MTIIAINVIVIITIIIIISVNVIVIITLVIISSSNVIDVITIVIIISVNIIVIITIVITISRESWNCPEYGMAFSGNDLAFFEEIPSWEECGEYFLYFFVFLSALKM